MRYWVYCIGNFEKSYQFSAFAIRTGKDLETVGWISDHSIAVAKFNIWVNIIPFVFLSTGYLLRRYFSLLCPQIVRKNVLNTKMAHKLDRIISMNKTYRSGRVFVITRPGNVFPSWYNKPASTTSIHWRLISKVKVNRLLSKLPLRMSINALQKDRKEWCLRVIACSMSFQFACINYQLDPPLWRAKYTTIVCSVDNQERYCWNLHWLNLMVCWCRYTNNHQPPQ